MPSPADSDLVTASLALLLPDEAVPVRLMNTIWADRHGVHDALTTTENLREWLAAVAPEDDLAPDSTDLSRFRTLRDALRRLAALATDDTRPAAASATTDMDKAIADVNKAARQAFTSPQLDYEDGELVAYEVGKATPGQRALSSIAKESIELLTGADRPRLRACYGPGCVLYFVKDHPRREWCSNACGNRARAARHYHRHRKSATGRAR